MADFPVVLVPNRIAALLDSIRRLNKPSKLNRTWLEANGFRSKNDRALATLLRSLGYLDGSGTPTTEYDQLRGSESTTRLSLGKQMTKAYPEVFANFSPDYVSSGLTRDELANFVRPKITAGDATVQNIVATFFALRSRADFTSSPATAADATPALSLSVPAIPARQAMEATAGSGLNVTISLSLEIPATSDADVYDKLFDAMARHLGAMMGRGRAD